MLPINFFPQIAPSSTLAAKVAGSVDIGHAVRVADKKANQWGNLWH